MPFAPHKYPGYFVTLEGGEGCGKTTFLDAFKEDCAGMDDIVFVNDPSKDLDSTKLVRELLLSGKYNLEKQSELLLYFVARCELVHKTIIPALKEGKLVVSDRFDLSTWAYQGAGRGFENFDIAHLGDFVGSIVPNMFIVFSLDPRIGVPRSKARLAGGKIDEGLFESLDMSFHDIILRYMTGAVRRDPSGRIIKMDKDTSREEVYEQALKFIGESGLL